MILQFFAKTLQQLDLTGVLALSSLGLKAAGVAAVTCSCGLPWCTSASGLGQAPSPRHMSNNQHEQATRTVGHYLGPSRSALWL